MDSKTASVLIIVLSIIGAATFLLSRVTPASDGRPLYRLDANASGRSVQSVPGQGLRPPDLAFPLGLGREPDADL